MTVKTQDILNVTFEALILYWLTFDLVVGLEGVHDLSVDLLLALEEPHLAVLGEELPHAVVAGLEAGVVELLLGDLENKESE